MGGSSRAGPRPGRNDADQDEENSGIMFVVMGIGTRSFFASTVVCFVATFSAFGQVQGGGAAAGIGRAFEATGRSQAAKSLHGKLNTALVRAVSRDKAVKKPAQISRTRRTRTAPVAEEPVAAVSTSTYFKPEPGSSGLNYLADELGSNATERTQLRALFAATKEAFEKEVAAEGRANNIAAAFTFFIASTVTVYRDDPEPSDEAIDNLWDGMSSALSEMPEVANLTNDEKQQMYDMLIAFSGFVLAGHMEAKSSGNSEAHAIFRQLAGVLIQTVLKTEPAKLRFNKDGLQIVG